MKNNFMKKYVNIFFVFIFFVAPSFAFAENASLSIYPANGIFPIGDVFTVEIRIDTGGNEVGTADATLVFNPNDLSYLSVSDEGSVFNTILVDSTRTDGEIDISGFVERGQKPYSGRNGLFAKVTFKPLRNVATQLHFSKGAATPPLSLTASVGNLANILSGLHAASYTLVPKETVPATVLYASAKEDFEITSVPSANDGWFGTTSVKLSWVLPGNVTKVKTTLSDSPESAPSDIHETPITSITLNDLKEGINYFLLQFRNGANWGSVITHPVKVDLTPPGYLSVKEAERKDTSNPKVSFEIDSSDTYSGLDYYEFAIDGGDSQKIDVIENKVVFQPEGLTPGEHVLTAKVFDKAGNATSTDFVFMVKALESPSLINDSVPTGVLTGDTVSVRGMTYPNSDVTVFISHNDGEAKEKKVKSDDSGAFVVTIAEKAKAGKYTLWFTVTNSNGATSPPSIKRSIEVKQPFIMLFGSVAVTYMSVIVPLVALIFLLGLVLWLVYTWIKTYRKRVKLETGEAYAATQKEFEALRKELKKQIGVLEKANQSRKLTREEMRIFTDLSKRLDKIERHIKQEIDDIEDVEDENVSLSRERDVKGSLERYKNKIKRNEMMASAVKEDGTIHMRPKRVD